MATIINGTTLTFTDGTTQTSRGSTRGFGATVYKSGSGVYVPPDGLKYIKVLVLGGGGGGGASGAGVANSRGDRGGYSSVGKFYMAGPHIASPIPYSVGTGGSGGSASPISGSPGSASTWAGVPVAGGVGGPGHPVPATSPAMSKAGSNPAPGAADIGPVPAPGFYSYSIQNGFYTESFGETGPTAGVPIWYDSLFGAGTPTVITNSPAPINGTAGSGYGVGGGGGRSGPGGTIANGAAGQPGIIIIEEYY